MTVFININCSYDVYTTHLINRKDINYRKIIKKYYSKKRNNQIILDLISLQYMPLRLMIRKT